MNNQTPVEVVGADQHVSDSSTGSVDRRPPWLLGAVVLVALGAIVTVALVTRDTTVATGEDTSPSTSFAPTTTIPSSTSTSTARSTPPPTVDNFTPDPTVANGGGTEVEFLPLSQGLVDVLPPGGIDGWLFSIRQAGQLTRTNLTTGDEARVRFDGRGPDGFFPGALGIVLLEDKVAVSGDGQLLIVDIETLSAMSIEHPHGVAPILANDDNTVWLLTNFAPGVESSASMVTVNIDSLEVGEPFTVDPFGIAFVVAGAGGGILRFHVPFVGSWEIANGVQRQIDNSILAGVNGATLEISCGDTPDECSALLREFTSGAESPIQITPQIFGSSISPNLDAVASADAVVYTDGSVVDLEATGFDGTPWVWSSDGRFLVNSNLDIVDLTGEFETFTVPSDAAFSGGPTATLLVMRPVD